MSYLFIKKHVTCILKREFLKILALVKHYKCFCYKGISELLHTLTFYKSTY